MADSSNMILKDFISELSSNSPAPGGGAVAALTSSISCALSCMVYNLTVDKKSYEEYDEDVKKKINDNLKEALKLKDEFLVMMDEDAVAFNGVIAAFKLPKQTEEEKMLRSNKIQEEYLKAMEVPLNVARKTLKIYDYLEIAAMYGNKNAISDAGVGTLMCQTAIESAILNVKINLGSIKDKELVIQKQKECDDIVESGNIKKAHIMECVYSKL